MPEYSLDYETRSCADLPSVGSYRYAYDESTEILCFSLSKDGEEPKIWVPKKWVHIVQGHMPIVPDSSLIDLSKKENTVSAFNANFECAITDALFEKTTKYPSISHEQWRCVAAMARRAALPSSLKKIGDALKLTEKKDDKGMALIRKFSIPQKGTGKFIEPEDDPESFIEFCQYCLQDTRTEVEAKKRLSAFELKGGPLKTFQLDISINSRGFPVNLEALAKADILVKQETEKLTQQFRQLTGLNPTQGEKIKAWLEEKGSPMANLQSATLDEMLEEDDFDATTLVGQVLTIKKRIGFASLKKIGSMLACAGPKDNRVRGTLTYHGAGTGRSSASLVQPQNFKRPAAYMESLSPAAYADIIRGCDCEWLEANYGPPLEVISSCIRHFIQDDGPMISMDYSSIEARLLAWQANEPWKLEVFKTHGMIYEAAACQMFGMTMQDFKDYKKAHGKHHPMRQKSKAGELGCGYAGGVGALVKMGALKQGLTEEELPGIIKIWRESNPNIVKMWGEIERAAKSAIKNHGKIFPFGVRCNFFATKTAGMDYLFMTLPSGRKIAYPQPELVPQLQWREKIKTTVIEENAAGEKIEVIKMVDGEFKKIFNPTPEQIAKTRIKYPKARLGEAITIFSQIPKSSLWGRVAVHAGIFCNNQIQGIAADFMACGALNAEAAGYPIYSLIHDEILSGFDPEKHSLEELEALMIKLPAWAEGMPLAAEGGIVPFYQK